MMRNALVMLVASLTLLGGCAHTARNDVIIDPAGVDMAQYEKDLGECQKIASQVRRRGTRGAVAGAIVGGALGNIGGRRGGTERGARAGAVIGGAKGMGATRREMVRVLKNCISSRGYTVLN